MKPVSQSPKSTAHHENGMAQVLVAPGLAVPFINSPKSQARPRVRLSTGSSMRAFGFKPPAFFWQSLQFGRHDLIVSA